jgi:succinoglycan biosynthesis protein ExoM
MAERVSVCVATYRRPHGLERLLRALDGLTFREAPPEVETIVVDNDPAGSAAASCAALAGTLRTPLRYVHEPRRGIAQARNRALAVAAGDADHVAFLDDDETPSAVWLDELLRVRAACGADAVAGPVVARFEEAAPAWVARGGFFERERHPTGRRLPYCGTGNVLLSAAAVRAMPRHFDERLGLTGGEDTDFFLRFTAAGFTLVWADAAAVDEWIPASRARAGWILRREYRRANTWSHCERELLRVPGASRVAKGVIRIVQGVGLLPLGIAGRHRTVQALGYVARGAGNVAGAAGFRYREYEVTHGG